MYFIINSQASRVQRNLDRLQELIKEFHPKSTVEVLDNPKKLTKVCDAALKAKAQNIVIVGGDGTIIGCTEYLLKNDYQGEISIVPLGTANYLARNINTPLALKDCIETLDSRPLKSVRLARANGRAFSLFLSMGLTTEVSKNIDVSFKQTFGQFAYVAELFRQLTRSKIFDYSITADDTTYTGKAHQILVVNSDLSHQIPAAPSAQIDDHNLKLVIYAAQSRLKLVLSVLIYMVTLGKKKVAITEKTVRTVEISTKKSNNFALDGEIQDATKKITISVDGRDIKMR